jgi:hypothetical protein
MSRALSCTYLERYSEYCLRGFTHIVDLCNFYLAADVRARKHGAQEPHLVKK